MKKMFLAALAASLLLASAPAFAQSAESPVTAKFLLEGGVEYGGDEILQVFFTNGEDQTMRAGQGGYLAVGGELQFAKVKNLLLRASIGLKYNTTAAENANIRLTRVPLTLIPYWKIKDDFRVGVGITSHQAIRFKGDGIVPDVDYTSTLGPRFEVGYKWIAITYTAVTYTDEMDESFSAGSIGVSLSLTLPQ